MTPIPDRQGSGSAMRLDMRRGAPELVATQGDRRTAPHLQLVRTSNALLNLHRIPSEARP
jgi:hypothetical protein